MLDLEPIKARLAAATSQPWEVAEAHTYKDGKQTVSELFVRRPDDDVSIAADILDPTTSNPSQANADFIAHTPADVWALIGEVERLRAALAVYADRENWYCASGDHYAHWFRGWRPGKEEAGYVVAEAALGERA
jgi:hypothetical protein